MAVTLKTETSFGETRDLYIRLNNVEASNHGALGTALFRGFLSKEAFEAKKTFVFEETLDFAADVSKPLWEQAYAAFKTEHPEAEDC